jgi:plasmid stabilization system protein ParE
MRSYFLSKLAENDIDDIVSYIAKENKKAAKAMDNLSDNPMIGHTREDLTKKPVRFWPVKWRYLVVCTVSSPIEIVRVLSGYRDFPALISLLILADMY